MISSLEDMSRKQEQVDNELRDDLKEQIKNFKSSICSKIETSQELYNNAQLLATKKSSALLHELLEKFSNMTFAFEKLKTENELLAQQLKNRSDVTQGGSPTPPRTVKDKDISSPVLAAAPEIANTSNSTSEEQDTPNKDERPTNIMDPSSPGFSPGKAPK